MSELDGLLWPPKSYPAVKSTLQRVEEVGLGVHPCGMFCLAHSSVCCYRVSPPPALFPPLLVVTLPSPRTVLLSPGLAAASSLPYDTAIAVDVFTFSCDRQSPSHLMI